MTVQTEGVSIVIPFLNEVETADAVTVELTEFLSGHLGSAPWEIVFVDDGSSDGTSTVIARHLGARVRLLRHEHNAGKSAAIRTGARHARHPWIVTMDCDGQDDPRDLPAFFAAAAATPPPALIGGVREKRRDTAAKRIASRIGNGVREFFLRDGCPDSGCGYKMFRRDAFLGLVPFEGMHRFLPALFQYAGHGVAYVPVHNRPRKAGVSKYTNFGRAVVGTADLLGVLWLRRHVIRPTNWTEL